MSRLREEVSIISRGALAFSLILAGALALLILLTTSGEPVAARIAGMTLAPAVLLVYLLLVSYVHADSKRRGMRPVMWTLVALFVPNAIGIIAYFIVREPVLHPCPSCGTAARREFAFCPSCGVNLPRTCPSCHRPVEPVWTHCAHCGDKLSEAAAAAEAPSPAMPPSEMSIKAGDPEGA